MSKVYIKTDEANNIIEINSDIFIENPSQDWILIDEGYGDKYVHAQGNYLDKPLFDELGRYNFKYIGGEIIELAEIQKPNKNAYLYPQLVEQKIRARYTVSDELAILRQKDVKPLEFDEYNTFCEQCKTLARYELGL